MPLRLKHLDLHGYKTFAARTEFAFGAGISAIVGPNGSGKSNIVDSIRWVLGEQSFGLLRGKKTEDMIYAGSEQRPRAGMAEATLTFDNTDGWLPIDFSEVSITRRAYRDGNNEYLLNGQRVRLRDISELLAQCGLAERNYTIIGQGLIDTALSLKAEERRALFEEAAGIGVYRNKREDALRKLDATQRNLERVRDIVAEIKPRLRSLERQAQRARDYQQVKADLHAILKTWYGHHWHRALAEVEHTRLAAELTDAELTDAQNQQAAYGQQMADLRARMAGLRAQLGDWRAAATHQQAEHETVTRELAVAAEHLRLLAEQRTGLAAEQPALQAQLSEHVERVAAAQAKVTQLADEAQANQRQVEAVQAALAERETQRARLQQTETEARATLTRLDAQMFELRVRQNQLSARDQQLTVARGQLRSNLQQLQEAEAAARTLVNEASARLKSMRTVRLGAESQVTAQTDACHAAEAALRAATERATTARTDLERQRARQEVLEQARAELAGFASGVKHLLAQNFPTRGPLAELITVPAELETALGAVLGGQIEALVVQSRAEAEAARQQLGSEPGRAALLPLQDLTAPEPLTPPADPDCLGVAAQLIQAEASLRPALNLLLGQVCLVRDAAAAQRLAAHSPTPTAIFVTLAGEIYHAAGPVVLGRAAAPTSLQQARERRDLSAEIETQRAHCEQLVIENTTAAQTFAAAQAALTEAQTQLHDARDQERQAIISRDSNALEAERVSHTVQFQLEQFNQLETEAAQISQDNRLLKEELDELYLSRHTALAQLENASTNAAAITVTELTAQLSQLQTAGAVAERAAQSAAERAAELERARVAAAARLDDWQVKIQKLEAETRRLTDATADQRQRAAALAAQMQQHQLHQAPAEQQLAELEAEQTRLEADDTQSRSRLHVAERHNAQAQLDHTRKAEELDNLRRRVEEDFGLVEFDYGDTVSGPTPLPMYPIVEKLERTETLPEGLEEQLNQKRGQLRRMGIINPEADKEYQEVKDRHAFLTTQTADLEAAQTQLREVIAELDLLMERDFRKTFDAVANEFRDTFARLFGGGTAKLVLTDPDHLSTTGVDIQCRLPGKRPQTLAMLSGGERSLTACALVFALLRVSPTPFVVLDEVDAMLDEANVSRYRDMLVDLTGHTQFIVVTHNRNTVQVADTVYGVTMGNDGASQLISLKLDGQKVSTHSAVEAAIQ